MISIIVCVIWNNKKSVLTFYFILWNSAFILSYFTALGAVYVVTDIRELLRTCLGTLFVPPDVLSYTAYLPQPPAVKK